MKKKVLEELGFILGRSGINHYTTPAMKYILSGLSLIGKKIPPLLRGLIESESFHAGNYTTFLKKNDFIFSLPGSHPPKP